MVPCGIFETRILAFLMKKKMGFIYYAITWQVRRRYVAHTRIAQWGARIAQSVGLAMYLCRAGSNPTGVAIIEKKTINGSCTGMYQWFDCHHPGAVVSQGISRPNVENCPGFPQPLDSRRLRSRIA